MGYREMCVHEMIITNICELSCGHCINKKLEAIRFSRYGPVKSVHVENTRVTI